MGIKNMTDNMLADVIMDERQNFEMRFAAADELEDRRNKTYADAINTPPEL